MSRREFIAGLGGAAGWPLTAWAQQRTTPPVPVIGFLHPGSSGQFAPLLNAFGQGLSDSGFVEGRNVAIEYRWADGQSGRLRLPRKSTPEVSGAELAYSRRDPRGRDRARGRHRPASKHTRSGVALSGTLLEKSSTGVRA